MLAHNHQFAKPGVSDALNFHQHEINFCSLMLLFFPPAAFVYSCYFVIWVTKCMNKPLPLSNRARVYLNTIIDSTVIGLVDLQSFSEYQRPSLFTLISYCAIVFSFALMFANGWLTACDGFYGASAYWLSHMKQYTITVTIKIIENHVKIASNLMDRIFLKFFKNY